MKRRALLLALAAAPFVALASKVAPDWRPGLVRYPPDDCIAFAGWSDAPWGLAKQATFSWRGLDEIITVDYNDVACLDSEALHELVCNRINGAVDSLVDRVRKA